MAVLVVTGPICAGKSTATRRLADRQLKPTALVDLDAVRYQVRAGGLNPMAEIPPSDEALRQWGLAVDIAADAARRYDEVGYDCVIDAPGVYVDEAIDWWPFQLRHWERALSKLDWQLAVLLPPIDAVLERAAARPAERRPPEVALVFVHELMTRWKSVPHVPTIDTDALDVEATMAALEQRLHRNKPVV